MIRKYFVERQNKKLLAEAKSQLSFPQEIRRIAVIADNQTAFDQVSLAIQSYYGKQVMISGLFFSKEEQENGISAKDFSLFGKPNEKINGFLSEKFDFILTPSLQLNPYLLYLLLHSSETFKIGFFSPENKILLDLMLDQESKDLGNNIQDLLDYLSKIKAAC